MRLRPLKFPTRLLGFAPQRPQLPPLRAALPILAACCFVLLIFCSQHPSIEQVSKASNVLRVIPKQHGDERARRSRLVAVFHEKPYRNWKCPLAFERIAYKDVQSRFYKPYILGGKQQPRCRNCRRDHLWSHFCHFESDGPVCTLWDQWRFLDYLIARAEVGAPGAEEMLTMTPCDLFRLLEGRTLWLVGDSQTQELMKAMQCFFSEFWELDEEIKPADLAKTQKARFAMLKQPTGWCITMLRDTRICHLRGNYGSELAEDIFPNLPHIGANISDIVVFNFGLWHNDLASFSGNASAVAQSLISHRASLPFLIWRESSPQHFDTPQGEYGCQTCQSPHFPYICRSIRGVFLDKHNRLHTTDARQEIVKEGGWRNRILRPLMDHLGIPVLEVWNQSLPLWDYHHNYQELQDCTHMCHPSAYQLWVAELYLLLRRSVHNSGSSISGSFLETSV